MHKLENPHLDLAEEVKVGLSEQRPIVALESTIIAHGMPYPQNVETALKVEQCVRDYGAIPATIAIMEGRLKVGLSDQEVELLGKLGAAVIKTSRRDLPYLVSRKLTGATTVATTMIIAEMADIPVFATGGIGGVHRGAELSMDVSADLQELAQTKVAVVSAGAKAILDLKLTLEYLETHGVPVIGYQTKEFPAFFTRTSGLEVDYQLDTPQDIAGLLRTKWELGLKGGVLIANPIPEKFAMQYEFINQAIERAVEEANERKISGKSITPFLLSKIVEITGGKSLEANIELVLNNVKLAAEVAKGMKA